jgi:hypothetical protein
MNVALILILIFPLIWPMIAKMIFHTKLSYVEMALNIVIACLLSAGTYYAGRYSEMHDQEVLNGEILNKNKMMVSCEHSYSCNCRTIQSCSGSGKDRQCSTSTVCDTCYEHSHDWTWILNSNVGNITINREDRQGNIQPQRWSSAKIGEAVAMPHSYVNYVKAASDSLFHSELDLMNIYKEKIPEYPLNIYDYHRLNRFLMVGVDIADADKWNEDISNMLKKLGPQREMNLIILVTNITDAKYANAVKASWNGSKKNDVLVIIGIDDTNILWTSIQSWSKNELFNIELRDKILDIKQLNRKEIISEIRDVSERLFNRRSMKEFEYLKDTIEPPLWIMIMAGIIGIVCSIGITYMIIHMNMKKRRLF